MPKESPTHTPDTDYLRPLARTHRSVLFYMLLFIFILVVPALIFYASGYRYTIGFDESRVQKTGAMYIWTTDDQSIIEINGEPVQSTRFFRRATYVQGLLAGVHDVAVYGDGLQTWAKRLPVYPQMVTEFSVFTLPDVPQVRPITPLINSSGDLIFQGYNSATSTPFAFASTTTSFVLSTSSAPLPYTANPEYESLRERFNEIIAARPLPLTATDTEPAFRFVDHSITSPNSEIGSATATALTADVRQGNMRLERRDVEIYAVYDGPLRTIPHYFCIPAATASTTASHYGEHVATAIHQATSTAATTTVQQRGTWHVQICRSEIRIDRKQQTVHHFDFVPHATGLVLLHLDNGIYVTEIDDRAWQNHQLLYPHSDVDLAVIDEQIFIQDGVYFAELFTVLQDR